MLIQPFNLYPKEQVHGKKLIVSILNIDFFSVCFKIYIIYSPWSYMYVLFKVRFVFCRPKAETVLILNKKIM